MENGDFKLNRMNSVSDGSELRAVTVVRVLWQRAKRACVTASEWSAFIPTNLFNRFGFFSPGDR